MNHNRPNHNRPLHHNRPYHVAHDVTTHADDLHSQIETLLIKMRTTWQNLETISNENRIACLESIADAIDQHCDAILDANQHDVITAEQTGVTQAKISRLRLDKKRLAAIVNGVREVAMQPDPLARDFPKITRPNGLTITQKAVPIGLIAMIYEARPNVTADAAALSLRSGNAILLRPGKDCYQTSCAIAQSIRDGLKHTGLPQELVQMVPTKDRAAVTTILHAAQLLDLVIPRGGYGLVKLVQEESRVPVLSHLEGVCHMYIDKAVNSDMALSLVVNAKMRRVEICGALETLLVDRAIANTFLPKVIEALTQAGCAIRASQDVQNIVTQKLEPATQEDWRTEYLAPIISIALVDGVDQAAQHINHYGSHHTDSICTEDASTARRFIDTVDSAIVMHNVSTQYADGGEFGLGAEIGISTGRLHARGPVGAQQLTTYKYVVSGDGLCRPV